MHNIYSLAFVLLVVVSLTACSSEPDISTSKSSSSSSVYAVASSQSSAPENVNPIIVSPVVGSVIKSPVTVQGRARGTWFAEGSLPIEITDSHNLVIATAPAQADGEWMTTDYVDFSVIIPFSTKQPFGFIVIKKDNPSGLPENDAQFKIPVMFK